MSGTVIAGIIIAIMFLVSFSEWFYHLVAGMNVLITNDVFVYYRIAGWGIGAVVFMAGIFWTLALIQECPLFEAKVGIFKYLNCNVYFSAQSTLNKWGLFLPTEQPPLDQPL